ncbi:hypothetical protein DFH28DRAFT_963035 [Melampsora americana]|nr:hypothetical protein DFH28DRAFT_963035 [Melampsora americana]
MSTYTSKKLRIGYVPEHFSSPLLQLIESDHEFAASVELIPNPSGTGEMIKSFKDGKIDVAIALTESLIAGIILGKGDYKLIGTYVTSPLNWAVITGAKSEHKSIEDLRGQKLGISRLGSGSQVMASVMALQHGWLADGAKPIEFVVNDTFKNLRDSVNDGSTAAFMWEWFTTKPFQDSGEVKFIGNVPTPWESWVIVASPQERNPEVLAPARLKEFLDKLDRFTHRFGIEKGVREAEHVDFVKNRFHQKEEDVKEWMKGVSYPEKCSQVSLTTVKETIKTLHLAGVIDNPELVNLPDDIINTDVAKVI